MSLSPQLISHDPKPQSNTLPVSNEPKLPADKLQSFPDIGPNDLSNCTFYNSTSFSGDENDSQFLSSQFSQLLLTEPSKKTSEVLQPECLDPSSLSEIEIRELIDEKMRKLDLFNSRLMLREQNHIMKKYKISDAQLKLLSRLQNRIRSWIMKRKFLKAVRMNDFVENRKNFLMLKRCMEKFDKQSGRNYSRYYESLLDMLMI